MQEFSELCLAEHERCADYTDEEISAEISAVIKEGIEVFAHSVGCPLSPNNNSGHKVADES